MYHYLLGWGTTNEFAKGVGWRELFPSGIMLQRNMIESVMFNSAERLRYMVVITVKHLSINEERLENRSCEVDFFDFFNFLFSLFSIPQEPAISAI